MSLLSLQREPTVEQRRMLSGLARTYNRARKGDLSEEMFWKVTLEEWLLRWPIVPDLVGRGSLPTEAITGVDLTEGQRAVVEAERIVVQLFVRGVMKEEWIRWREECEAIAYGGEVGWRGEREWRA